MPQLVTIRPKVVEPLERGRREGEVVEFESRVDESLLQTNLVDRVKEEELKLDEADAIVAGGRGVGGPKEFEELKDLAKLLEKSFSKVELVSSRPPVDLGWISSNRQIGLTGEKVAPDLYIAIGISGATQHLVGMSNSGSIIAINNDPNAPIFKYADYGIVSDYEKVLPHFKEKLRDLL